MITSWNGKPYHSLDYMLKERFGEKVYKVTLNGGMSCPNRDGTIGHGGCIFCSEGGSGDFAASAALSIHEQIAKLPCFPPKDLFTNTSPIFRLTPILMLLCLIWKKFFRKLFPIRELWHFLLVQGRIAWRTM